MVCLQIFLQIYALHLIELHLLRITDMQVIVRQQQLKCLTYLITPQISQCLQTLSEAAGLLAMDKIAPVCSQGESHQMMIAAAMRSLHNQQCQVEGLRLSGEEGMHNSRNLQLEMKTGERAIQAFRLSNHHLQEIHHILAPY